MCIDTSISSGACQILVLTVWNMGMSLWVLVFLCETKVDHVNLVASFADAHKEVVRLDVTVNEGLVVNMFNPGDKLVCEEKDSL